ncbi:Rz1-like lysis system protein LysC [Rosenbergiella epipactidis]|uniref:Rz1-like lysis system protein LysC n=1 Tax=Rosenbergiella epipactidis TaxID=1544694 RepID=UPI003F6BAD0A
MLLVSCSGTPTKYVKVPPVPIPESLTRKCPVPTPALPFTWQSSLLWNESLLTALENCNKDKAAIQQIELERQKND